MCGRFTQLATWEQVHAFSQPLLIKPPEQTLTPSWNLAPTQRAYVIGGEGQTLTPTWGFAPAWARSGPHPINARVESVASSKLFRSAFQRSRAIVPANGWYEWRQEDKLKQPYYFQSAGPELLWFAAITVGDTFAILTSAALPESMPIHDRSPVLLQAAELAVWLDPATESTELHALMLPGSAGQVSVHRVNRAVGNVRNNGPDLIEPLVE